MPGTYEMFDKDVFMLFLHTEVTDIELQIAHSKRNIENPCDLLTGPPSKAHFGAIF